ncbi:MAG: alpha-glucuronidase family glycosyl hydrolase [Cyclonatronaceae bacterium]
MMSAFPFSRIFYDKAALVLFMMMFVLMALPRLAAADDGYRAWLKYDAIEDEALLQAYRGHITGLHIDAGHSDLLNSAARELRLGLSGLLARPLRMSRSPLRGTIVAGTPESSAAISRLNLDDELAALGPEGYLIRNVNLGQTRVLIIAANEDVGVLYGSFALLRALRTGKDITEYEEISAPRVQHRTVNHWDNLDRLVERGYAGLSLWDWGRLPEYEDPRYHDYARLNASIGINGTAINNVNADPDILTEPFLERVAVLADIFRKYGIAVYLSINYHAPQRVGGLETSDPLDPDVQRWWRETADRIYEHIPDFGGFLVKADSEGQPGPHGYGRNHAEGANVLANALAPHGGIVIWRAFVYNPEQGDRFREAYDEFMPLDGLFADNVMLQIKNGPIDFQPREPFSPLFGGLEETPAMLELQITQEYFGFANHLTYKGPMYTEVLRADTHARGEGSTVGRILEGEIFEYELTGMAGVLNTGTDRNWTGHPFVQSSWYAYGRLAWNYEREAAALAEEWISMSFSNDASVIDEIRDIMMISREAGENYRTPLGLTHLYDQGHHYGPAPWISMDDVSRPDWSSQYYHNASEDGIGFDRTESGSNALEQYHEPVRERFADLSEIDEDYLLWFHHLAWDYELRSGRTLWHELVHQYTEGVEQVRQMRAGWQRLEGRINAHQFAEVAALLEIQLADAQFWRDACLSYFGQYTELEFPAGYEPPAHELQHYIDAQNARYIPDPWYN